MKITQNLILFPRMFFNIISWGSLSLAVFYGSIAFTMDSGHTGSSNRLGVNASVNRDQTTPISQEEVLKSQVNYFWSLSNHNALAANYWSQVYQEENKTRQSIMSQLQEVQKERDEYKNQLKKIESKPTDHSQKETNNQQAERSVNSPEAENNDNRLLQSIKSVLEALQSNKNKSIELRLTADQGKDLQGSIEKTRQAMLRRARDETGKWAGKKIFYAKLFGGLVGFSLGVGLTYAWFKGYRQSPVNG